MRKLHTYIALVAAMLALLCSCSGKEWLEQLSPEQKELLGRAVSFKASKAENFVSKATSDHSGGFNENDIMTIYRQYFDDENGIFDRNNEEFRVYYYKHKRLEGTGISLNSDWMVCDGSNTYLKRLLGQYSADGSGGRTLQTRVQTAADSLAWENGNTLRFRAWSRSNNSGTLAGNKSIYYPDFCISDWVNVSGPTNSIPLTLKHETSRIVLCPMAGNQISRVEICTEAADYERDDNADSTENDAADKTWPKTYTIDGKTITINSAEEAAAGVKAVYSRMCMPAGVNIEEGTLRAMTKAAYAGTSDFSHIEEWEYTEEGRAKYLEFGEHTQEDIADQAQRPVFAGSIDSRFYLLSIPYDMSNGSTKGDMLTLPPYTRFRVWLYDVNSGDTGNINGLESEYHILSLEDIRENGSEEPFYKNGMDLKAGYSYLFYVGYRYNKLSIVKGDSFSWEEQDEISSDADEEIVQPLQTGNYSWWKNAIKDAIPRGNEAFNPEFHITSEAQFMEMLALVNGEACRKGQENPIYRLVYEWETKKDENGLVVKIPKTYKWSRTNDQNNPVWAEKAELEQEGYIFYEDYHPADGDKEAYSEENYLNHAYSFYDALLNRHFNVYLDKDLDFKDMKTDPVGVLPSGTNTGKAFMGYFDACPKRIPVLDENGEFTFYSVGEGENADKRIQYLNIDDNDAVAHKISNLNVRGGYLFSYVMDAAIRNLLIESYHTTGLLDSAAPSMDGENVVGWGCYIVGVSVRANNLTSHNAIARSLLGRSYVVGCIHEGDAGGPLVGTADNLFMYGCMRTAANISGSALLGTDLGGTFKGQYSKNNFTAKPGWGRLMCCYYNKDIHEDSKDAVAVGTVEDDYSQLEYIRGRASRILRAKSDNLLKGETKFSDLKTWQQREEYYGLAPWKAMDYAIYRWNTDDNLQGKTHACKVHYEVEGYDYGYNHSYPRLMSRKPELAFPEVAEWNVLKQKN